MIEYRKLGLNDLNALRELNELFAAAFEDPATHLSKLPSDSYLAGLLGKNHFIALAALSSETVVGGLVAYVLEKYEQERSEIYLYDLAVAETHRRRGIARKLIIELKALARAIGSSVIFVQADQVDTPAIKLYQSMGTQEAPLHFDIPVEN